MFQGIIAGLIGGAVFLIGLLIFVIIVGSILGGIACVIGASNC